MSRFLIPVAAATLAAACSLALPQRSEAAATCASSTYSYAGVASIGARYGVAASISAVRRPNVLKGHVAAWVGVGGAGLGPGSTDEWLQVGISALPGEDPALYYEVALPNQAPRYVMLKGHLPIGKTFNVSVLESRSHPGSWRVWVNGSKMTAPIFLPGSHGAWRPIATAESWSGDTGGTCNAFAFKFQQINVAAKPGGDWQPIKGRVLADAGYHVQHETQSALLASGG
ncbi:MAG: hypothetical protein QOI27_2180 [Gaiellaceae bacterium]|nr:hypothetical protein [Gaiellaceae bacterium]MDX6468543.1 hypothetical protein [Gaiellaceae bacterium]